MADTDATPMGESDFTADSNTHVAAPLKGSTTDAKQAIKDGATKYTAQAADKARSFADDGKARAGTALDQIAQLLTDAAGQVDEKLGAQYGTYARSAADSVSGFAEQVKAKDMDELIDDARELVRKSPAIAVGAAAAVGFVIARLVQSGVDANPKG
ncbi:MAG TPA: hypothetical protein VNJ10_15020 [Sphingomonas sp.]|nr:hypothetical protein [Sphingomonas sp.]